MKVFVAGDLRPSWQVRECFESGNFAAIFGQVKTIISKTDYSLINLESPVVESDAEPIVKCGPNLKCGISALEAVQWAGFRCVTLANNHFFDYGETGVSDTLSGCHKLGLDYVGGGIDFNEASKTLFKDVSGERLAIINCCEHEFSIASDKSAGSNPLDPIRQYYDIQDARRNADRVLVIVHGGIEHFQLPTPRMVKTYRFFIDAGADAVVNHHQHCYSGYEVYNGKPIFYGLGNFCYLTSKIRSGSWTEGYSVIIDFNTTNPTFQLFPYIQNASEVGVFFKAQNFFEKELDEINEIIHNPEALQNLVESYYETNTDGIANLFEPFYNKYFIYAKQKGWIPSMISKKRTLFAKNVISCESHLDRLLWWLEKKSHQFINSQ